MCKLTQWQRETGGLQSDLAGEPRDLVGQRVGVTSRVVGCMSVVPLLDRRGLVGFGALTCELQGSPTVDPTS